ncbi:MAG: energy transducer TonB [Proteobacteria bacterium]|nr:energy transducer TonB [Pseudomonadota bacterium]
MTAIPAPAQAHTTPALAGKPSISLPPRVEIIALTSDDTLLEQIGQALDGEATFRHVESVDAAREFIRPLRPCVLLLDARGQQDLTATVEGVQSPDGTCIVVVLASPDESANVARSVKGSATFAILSIPFEQSQTSAVLDGAREEALARLTLATQPSVEPAASESAPIVVAPASAPASARAVDQHGLDVRRSRTGAISTAGSAGGSKLRTWLPIAAGVVLIAVTAALFTLRPPNTDERAPATTAPASRIAEPAIALPATDAADVQAGSSDELLDRARVALNARHYTDPAGDNALAYFRAVLAQDPANEEAREGLQRIDVLLDERLQSELALRKFNDAAGTLAQLKLIRPGDPGLARVEAKLAEAQVAAADEISRRQGAAHAQQLAQLVSARIREDKLVDPASDSAKVYLAQLRRMPLDPKGLADAATAELTQALLLKIREAAAQPQRDDLERWLAAARGLGVSPTQVAAAIRAAPPAATAQPPMTQPEQLAQRTADRINDRSLPAPSPDSALAKPSPPRQLPPGEFKRIRYVPPEYPKDALKRGIGGEVRVRMTLDADGKVKAAEIVNSSPAGVFDRAALDAVRRWRFKPLAVGNPDIEATVVTNILFRPDDVPAP